MHFVLIHCRLYERILQFSFLYTSLNAKFTLAARARAAEHARARRGAAAARPANCVEGLANLPLLAGLGSAEVQSGVSACSGHLPAMLNRWLGWLSSSEPVAGSAESGTSPALAACEESSHDEALLGTITVPQANTAAKSCPSCVDDGDEVSAREVLEGSSGSNQKLGNWQDGTERRQCLFAVLSDHKGGHRMVPCVRNCRGQRCGRDDGHICSKGPGAVGGGELTGSSKAKSDRLASIDSAYAQAVRRCWRREWGLRMSTDELMKHALCSHAEGMVRKYLPAQVSQRVPRTPEKIEPESTTVPLDTDCLCAEAGCNASRKTLQNRNRKQWRFSNGDVFNKVGDVWACRKHAAAIRQRQREACSSEAAQAARDRARGSVQRRLNKPLSTDSDGLRRVRYFAGNISSQIEAEVERTADPDGVAEAVGSELEKKLPGVFPRAEEKATAFDLMKGIAPVLLDRGASKEGGTPHRQRRNVSHAAGLLIGSSTIPVRRTERLMREITSGQQSDASSRSSGALRGFITETRKRRHDDPDLQQVLAAPRRTRNLNVFKNNVAAILLVLKCWVESAQFCGCKSDIGRCPPGVRLTKADKRLAVENGWKPEQNDVSLVLGDDGVAFASDGERRRQRNVLRTACSGDDIYELVIKSHQVELAQTGCRAFFIEDAYWVRRKFGWFIKPFDRRATEACACDTCHGIKWLVRRMASLKKDSLNVRSLMAQHLCPPSNLVYGGGVNAGGTEVMVYSNQCLRGECSACTMEWSAGLSMLQSCRSCSWHQFVMVEEGTDKKGKPRKNMRVRKQTGTGRELERRIQSALPAYLLHHRDVVLCYHATRQAMRSGYAMWVDYSSRMTICNTFNPQSSEMTPQE
eukprot:COSAG02_NODE_2525_length_8606_cov_5.841895_7_plen_863_part_01